MGKSYDSKDIVILEGLDAVRLRTGMYIGNTGIKGIHHILWKLLIMLLIKLQMVLEIKLS